MADTRTCPACGNDNRRSARFCRRCGEPLPEASASEAPPEHEPPSAPVASMTPSQREAASVRTLAPVLWLMCVLLATSGVLFFATKGEPFANPTLLLNASIFDALVILGFAISERAALAALLRRTGLDARGIGRTAIALAFTIAFVHVYFWLLRALSIGELRYLDDFRAFGWPIWSAFLLISPMPAVVEEIAFRGFIWLRLERVARPRDVLFIQAALFSVMHLLPMVFASHFVIGLVLGWLRRETRSLYPPMIAHAAWNAIVLLEELAGIG